MAGYDHSLFSPRSRATSMPVINRVSPKVQVSDLRCQTSPTVYSGGQLAYPRSRALTLYYHQFTEEGLPLLNHSYHGETVRNCTISKAVFNILCAMIGAGVLGLPGTLAGASWPGLLLIVAVGYVMHYTGQCMTRCVLEDPDLITFRDLGEKAFGWPGQFTVLILQIIICAGTAVLFIVLAADNLQLMMGDWVGPLSKTTYLSIATLMALPFCYLRNLDDISWVSLAGLLSSLIALACMVASIFLHCLPQRRDTLTYGSPSVTGLLATLATASFSYGGHVVFPGILQVMKRPEEFTTAVSVSFVILVLVYGSFSLLCYYTFGTTIEDSVLKNLPETPLRTAGVLLITAHVTFAFSLYLNPMFYLLEEALGIEMASGALQSRKQIAGRVVVRTIITILLLAVAILVPFFGDIMTLVGGSAGIGSVVILPPAIYWKLHRRKLGLQAVAAAWLTVVFGCITAVLATISAADDVLSRATNITAVESVAIQHPTPQ